MFVDQAHYIQTSINEVMNNPDLRGSAKTFHIVGHSIGCLIAMYIEQQISDPDFLEQIENYNGYKLKNVVCLGSPILKSPTFGLNRNLEHIQNAIARRAEERKKESDTTYVVFNGGKKDFHITETFTYKSIQQSF